MALLTESITGGVTTGHPGHHTQIHKKLNNAWYDVKADFNATGDGSTNDYTAIQAALDAIPAAGGVVYFPPGRYRCGTGLVPKANTRMLGTHNLRYVSDQLMTSASSCVIECATGFSDTALIKPATGTKGLSFDHIAFCGRGQGSNVDGVFAPLPSNGEMSWSWDNVQINGFTGSGFHGSQHVGIWTNCFISHNNGWGMNFDGSHKLADCKMIGMIISFNNTGGMNFDSTFNHGLLHMANCRIERSGGNHANVAAPLNTDAPGLRIRSLQNSSFTNVSTDANSGHGVDISHASAGRANKSLTLAFVNCDFKRDGYGDGTTIPERAGVYIKGFSSTGADAVVYNNFVNCKVIAGKADDAGSFPASYTHPKRGVWIENAQYIDWITGLSQGSTSNYYFGASAPATHLWRCQIQDSDALLMTAPSTTTGSRPTNGIMPGSVVFDTSLNKLITYNGTNWRDGSGTAV